ncbi:polysaccharide pyruvyl transferase family protein [Gillisia limnaea]|uniref:ExoV-like protein n=1 Tax=Gillisia limnaea (strain DSM 15749 / LMG 21470 / R-8282) TaxID=865937 RepID=H2BRT3_GILLR|nr:polysaccharide pyruvyl transferase family protein [Gillisia limnaea]EHQ01398.1 ExoV-like protein [Gillisia limnaea DSM 15749]
MNIAKSLKFRFRKIKNKIITFPVSVLEKYKYNSINGGYILAGGGGWSKNFGDALNTILIEFLSEKKIIHADFLNVKKGDKIYIVIGSILQWVKKPSVIWGAGFIAENSTLKSDKLEILAVRGPLTLKILEKEGYDTLGIALGDPALLLPYMYFPDKKPKKFKVGLIPHYADKNHDWIQKVQKQNKDLTVIDIMCGLDWKNFIDEILDCDIILSSSLHGLIVSDAYGIPTQWISFSNKVLGAGFKFEDYYESINVDDYSCQHININTNLDQIIAKATFKPINLDIPKLINSCPFITPKARTKLHSNYKNIEISS